MSPRTPEAEVVICYADQKGALMPVRKKARDAVWRWITAEAPRLERARLIEEGVVTAAELAAAETEQKAPPPDLKLKLRRNAAAHRFGAAVERAWSRLLAEKLLPDETAKRMENLIAALPFALRVETATTKDTLKHWETAAIRLLDQSGEYAPYTSTSRKLVRRDEIEGKKPRKQVLRDDFNTHTGRLDEILTFVRKTIRHHAPNEERDSRASSSRSAPPANIALTFADFRAKPALLKKATLIAQELGFHLMHVGPWRVAPEPSPASSLDGGRMEALLATEDGRGELTKSLHALVQDKNLVRQIAREVGTAIHNMLGGDWSEGGRYEQVVLAMAYDLAELRLDPQDVIQDVLAAMGINIDKKIFRAVVRDEPAPRGRKKAGGRAGKADT